MNFKELRKMLFSVSLIVGLVACETQTEEQRNVEAQNQRVYVQNLENRILELVDRISEDGEGSEIDVDAIEAEIRAGSSDGEVEAQEPSSISLEMAESNERQARIEAMLITYQADLEALLLMYQEALVDCGENCSGNTPVTDLEDEIIEAGQELSEVIEEAQPAASEEVVAEEETAVEEDPETSAAAATVRPEVSPEGLLTDDEILVVSEITELTRRATLLTQEKSELFEALNRGDAGFTLDYVSERVQSIDNELATIASERSALTDELVRLRLTRIEAA